MSASHSIVIDPEQPTSADAPRRTRSRRRWSLCVVDAAPRLLRSKVSSEFCWSPALCSIESVIRRVIDRMGERLRTLSIEVFDGRIRSGADSV